MTTTNNQSNQPIIEFNPKLPKLSANEKAVLKLLVEAAKLIAPIYLDQERQLTKDSNQSSLSPFTVLEKVNGKFVETPYHIKYADLLKPIADKLNEAAEISEDKEFGKFLKFKAKVLLNGNYEGSLATRRKLKPYKLDIYIGPVEHHDDRLFFDKASYQAWVGVVDQENTKMLNYYKDIVLSAQRKALMPSQRMENEDNVRAKALDVIIFSGHMARTKFVGVNLPMSLNWVKKYGSEITLFNQANDLRLKEQILPTFNKIFLPEFRKGFSVQDLQRGNSRYVVLHELAHNFLYYKNAAKNLKDLLSPIYELSASVLGMRMAGSLLLRDIINNKQLESMIIAFICRSYYLIERGKTSKVWFNYSLGGAVFINFLIKSGALKEYKGLVVPNFMKIFISLQDLLYSLEELLSSGTRKDAEAFLKKYGQFTKLP